MPTLAKAIDSINYPAHYTQYKYEPIDVILAWDLDFCLGNVLKYISRYRFKGEPVENLKKARYYLDRKIKEMEQA